MNLRMAPKLYNRNAKTPKWQTTRFSASLVMDVGAEKEQAALVNSVMVLVKASRRCLIEKKRPVPGAELVAAGAIYFPQGTDAAHAIMDAGNVRSAMTQDHIKIWDRSRVEGAP